MPYTIRYVKYDARPWKIVNETNDIVGSSLTKEDAEKSIRARLAKIVNETNDIVGSSLTKEDAEKSIRARLAGEHNKNWKEK